MPNLLPPPILPFCGVGSFGSSSVTLETLHPLKIHGRRATSEVNAEPHNVLAGGGSLLAALLRTGGSSDLATNPQLVAGTKLVNLSTQES
ncbi:hypothetical protein V2J09_019418 [Rumex salicifolius]